MRKPAAMTTEVHDLRWPTYPGRGLMLDAAVFDSDDQPGALRVRDVDGKVYLDGVAGVGCAVLGHGHRAWAAAIHGQLAKLTSVANTFYTEPQQQLAARLAGLAPDRSIACGQAVSAEVIRTPGARGARETMRALGRGLIAS